MPGKIWKYTHRLDLNFLVLCRQYIKFNAVEDSDPDLISQQLFLRQIIEKYIGYAGDGVEYEFFADVERPLVDCLNKCLYKELQSTFILQ